MWLFSSEINLRKKKKKEIEEVESQTFMASTFPRIGFTKRRATTAKQPVSPGFLKNIGFSFIGILKTLLMHMTYIARTPRYFTAQIHDG